MLRTILLLVSLAVVGAQAEYRVAIVDQPTRLSQLLPDDAYYLGVHWARTGRTSFETRQSCWSMFTHSITDIVVDPALLLHKPDTLRALQARIDRLPAPYRMREYAEFVPDQLLSHPFSNRILRPGDRLTTSDVPTQIWIMTLQGIQPAPYQPRRTARDYLVGLRDQIRGDWAWVITPDGHARLAGVGLWNATRDAIAPGAVVFAPPRGLGRSDSKKYECLANALGHLSGADWAQAESTQ